MSLLVTLGLACGDDYYFDIKFCSFYFLHVLNTPVNLTLTLMLFIIHSPFVFLFIGHVCHTPLLNITKQPFRNTFPFVYSSILHVIVARLNETMTISFS